MPAKRKPASQSAEAARWTAIHAVPFQPLRDRLLPLGTLERLMQGRTTLIIAHRLSTVMNADEILVMQSGHVIERGTHAALLEADGSYARMWTLQQLEQASENA